MKMFLTRLGYNSKAVVTGDITQIDLPSGKLSGLKEARTVLASTPGINFRHFDDRDVVRHRLVQPIILAYEAFNRGRRRHAPTTGPERHAIAVASSFDASGEGTPLRARAQARRHRLMKAAGLPDCELSLTLTSDDSIRALNRDYRNKIAPTDVLSFSQIEEAGAAPPNPRAIANIDGMPLGDVVISLDTARARRASSASRRRSGCARC